MEPAASLSECVRDGRGVYDVDQLSESDADLYGVDGAGGGACGGGIKKRKLMNRGLSAGRGRVRAGLLAGALLLAGGAVLAQGRPLYTSPLGVEAYTYRNSWPRGVVQTLDTIK